MHCCPGTICMFAVQDHSIRVSCWQPAPRLCFVVGVAFGVRFRVWRQPHVNGVVAVRLRTI
jgi:hypothetical protein